MNSLYTLGVRQTTSIQADLERLRGGDASAALLGQIAASLAAMNRTVDDYDSMARREVIAVKQEKAQMRVSKFRQDHADMRSEFERLRTAASNEQQASSRSELLGTNSSEASRRRVGGMAGAASSTESVSESPFRSASPYGQSSSPYSSMQDARQTHALREHAFAQNTNHQLDDFIAQGRAALDNLVDQRQMLKGTQKRLRDAANTLGLSRNVIGWIERRSTQDMYIFFGGAAFTFLCFYLILKYLG